MYDGEIKMIQTRKLTEIRTVERITTCSLDGEPYTYQFFQCIIRIGPRWKVYYRKDGESNYCPKLNLFRECDNCNLYVKNNGHLYCVEKLRELSDQELLEIINSSFVVKISEKILVIDSTHSPVGRSQIFE